MPGGASRRCCTENKMRTPIEILRGDITKISVDAIVNAANTTLLGGGGVDGAIHRAAGTQLLEACRTLGGCPTGEARITRGYNLPAQWVIHTVGPVWSETNKKADGLLASCYRNCFGLAERQGIKSIAFPSLSTGAYRFPVEKACRIALRETLSCLREKKMPEKVIFICFEEKAYRAYTDTWGELKG